MKFGGTSVADAAALRRLIDHVRTAIQGGARPIVVVSALGGVTNELLRVAAGAASGDDVDSLLSAMRARHLDLASQVSANDSTLAAAIADQFDELQAIVRAVLTLKDASPRALDAIAAAGELLSSRILHKALVSAGIDAAWAILENSCSPTTTTRRRRRSSIASTSACRARSRRCSRPISCRSPPTSRRDARGGDDDARPRRLGLLRSHHRGGNSRARNPDLDRRRRHADSDPRVVAAPRVVPVLSFGEASELAYFGAKVLHPSTILPAVARDIPVRIPTAAVRRRRAR